GGWGEHLMRYTFERVNNRRVNNKRRKSLSKLRSIHIEDILLPKHEDILTLWREAIIDGSVDKAYIYTNQDNCEIVITRDNEAVTVLARDIIGRIDFPLQYTLRPIDLREIEDRLFGNSTVHSAQNILKISERPPKLADALICLFLPKDQALVLL